MSKTEPPTPVALIHDPLFLEHRAPAAAGVSSHPERPERLAAIMARLESDGILERLLIERPPAASPEQLHAVHDPAHVEAIRRLSDEPGGALLDADTYAGPASYRAAVHAAGAALHGVDLVLDGRARRSLSLARPPGHHATPGRAMGFCLFNSVAVAAAHARARGLERVFILDWDVHHGNGTQDAFLDDPAILYLSAHQWPLYPGTGALRETGEGAGRGTTVNVPLPAGTGDDGYRRVIGQVVAPAARRFAPELILVSAGYDAHAADPLAGMLVTTGGFGVLARAAAGLADDLCGGRLVACLEGGYDLEALADSVLETLAALAGEPSRLVDVGDSRNAPRAARIGSAALSAGPGSAASPGPASAAASSSGRGDAAAAEIVAAVRRTHRLDAKD